MATPPPTLSLDSVKPQVGGVGLARLRVKQGVGAGGEHLWATPLSAQRKPGYFDRAGEDVTGYVFDAGAGARYATRHPLSYVVSIFAGIDSLLTVCRRGEPKPRMV